ncbi:MAG: hypothetical protein IRZ02_02930 [Acidothermus sp.]|nr:hypothetical protein [Acidothermus sp.]MCL6537771.1 hypothetical protein [Acidothermus sp.]
MICAAVAGVFCERCGSPQAEGDHGACGVVRVWEPPRYCAQCGRRLVVQVLPVGWTARCPQHGEVA